MYTDQLSTGHLEDMRHLLLCHTRHTQTPDNLMLSQMPESVLSRDAFHEPEWNDPSV